MLLLEAIARTTGYCVGLLAPGKAYGAERKVRGAYWAIRFRTSKILIGRHVQLEGDQFKFGTNVRLFDGGQYVTASQGYIEIGDNSHISRMAVISGLGGITIGRGCAISAHVAIYSSTTDSNAPTIIGAPIIKKPVVIGDNVYIGVGAKIIPGITVGNNAVIAAGAVVTKDVPDDRLAKGVPAVHARLRNRRASGHE